MVSRVISAFLLILFVLPRSRSDSANKGQDFVHCLLSYHYNSSISGVIHTPRNASYSSILDHRIQNLRFESPDASKPIAILTPVEEDQIRTAIICSKTLGIQVRTRSGGHDFEGLSYRSNYSSRVPFTVIDLFNLRSIQIDVEHQYAWAETGATLGQLYYALIQESKNLAFAGGFWPTIGLGGHLSGGGYGIFVRKHGLASDNVLDARLMDADGRILDQKSMEEDVFWALNGGGGASFGVILSWKLKLVQVPEILTVCTTIRTLEQNATSLIHKWQSVAPNLDDNLLLELVLQRLAGPGSGMNVRASFQPVYLRRVENLLSLMKESFPELGLSRNDCEERSWGEVILYLRDIPFGAPIETLLNETTFPKSCFKSKADLVQKPIPFQGIEGLYELLYKLEPGSAGMAFTPFGARMNQISEAETPFPYRTGFIYIIFESVFWNGTEEMPVSQRHVDWIRELHDYMTDYVSRNPRGAYVNYKDLDLGVNNIIGHTSYEQAKLWGIQYFRNNFDRLDRAKAIIDPQNFFTSEQSIPLPNLMQKTSYQHLPRT